MSKVDRPGVPDNARPGRSAVVVAQVDSNGEIRLFGDHGELVGFDGEADRLCTAREVADGLGILPRTWRDYVRLGVAPEPDERGDVYRWRASTVAAWRATRRWRSKRVPLDGEK